MANLLWIPTSFRWRHHASRSQWFQTRTIGLHQGRRWALGKLPNDCLARLRARGSDSVPQRPSNLENEDLSTSAPLNPLLNADVAFVPDGETGAASPGSKGNGFPRPATGVPPRSKRQQRTDTYPTTTHALTQVDIEPSASLSTGTSESEDLRSEVYESPILNFSVADMSWVTATEAQTKYVSAGGGGSIKVRDRQERESNEVLSLNTQWNEDRPRDSNLFVEFLRHSSPYIYAHRNKTFVVHLPGQMLLERARFDSFMLDVALIKNIGVRVVLVAGSRPQIDRNVLRNGNELQYSEGVRISTPDVMEAVLEASGYVRFEIESALQRRPSNSLSLQTPNVASGNFFSAQPVGVVNGVDFGYAGRVRKIDVHKIERRLNEDDVVVLSNIGFAPSGALFNCQSEEVASACAAQLKADKLIYMSDGEMLVDLRSGSVMHNVPLSAANEFLRLQKERKVRRKEAGDGHRQMPGLFAMYLTESVKALKGGVTRAHMINQRVDGAILTELFTRDGLGLMISRDIYEGIRSAKISDIPGIMDIVRPLEEEGILIHRSRESLQREIHHFVVVVRDGMVIACAALVPYKTGDVAEIACFVVSPQYRANGKGDAMLGFLERRALSRGIQRLFILSVRAFHWFLERGFREGTVDDLPPEKRSQYNYARKPKIYTKNLVSQREVDEEELLRGL